MSALVLGPLGSDPPWLKAAFKGDTVDVLGGEPCEAKRGALVRLVDGCERFELGSAKGAIFLVGRDGKITAYPERSVLGRVWPSVASETVSERKGRKDEKSSNVLGSDGGVAGACASGMSPSDSAD